MNCYKTPIIHSNVCLKKKTVSHSGNYLEIPELQPLGHRAQGVEKIIPNNQPGPAISYGLTQNSLILVKEIHGP